MKIAQIAPLAESVPPKLYGGTERVVSYLTEELVRLGHDVTLFATADSETRAELVACAPRALRPSAAQDRFPYYALMLEQVRGRAADFDVLHFHIDHLHLPLFRAFSRKSLTTLHGRLDLPVLAPLYREFSDMPVVSVSRNQREALPGANWVGTVYHGLAGEICPFNPAPRGGYFAFLGRASPDKGLDRAIEIARRAGMRLRIAADVEPRPSLPGVEFLGEVGESGKPALLGNAKALVFPVDWPEPFGLAMIEAMSCGTPVVGWANGSVPEIVEDGVTGFVVESLEDAVAALGKAARLDRARVRSRFEERFSAGRMARDYLSVYRALGRRRPMALA